MDSEVKIIIEEQYQRAIGIIQKNKDGLNQLGELLIEQEVIFAEDLEKIFGKREWTARSTELEQEIKKDKKTSSPTTCGHEQKVGMESVNTLF